jgi:transposase
VGEHAPSPAHHGRRAGRPRAEPERRHHRHAEREDDGKGGLRGYDAAKKVKGRKRHVAVDASGLLLGIIVHAADIQDADGAWDLLSKIKPLYGWLRAVFADSAYNRAAMLLACFLLGLTLIIVRRVAGTAGFVVLPRRWVVERSLGWLGRWRRLAKDYEELPEVSEAMVTVAMVRLMLHRLAHPNQKEGVPEERWISLAFPPTSPHRLSPGQVTEAWVNRPVDMQVCDQGDRSVDHRPGSGNDLSPAAKPGEPVAQPAVCAFERDRLILTRMVVSLGW